MRSGYMKPRLSGSIGAALIDSEIITTLAEKRLSHPDSTRVYRTHIQLKRDRLYFYFVLHRSFYKIIKYPPLIFDS